MSDLQMELEQAVDKRFPGKVPNRRKTALQATPKAQHTALNELLDLIARADFAREGLDNLPDPEADIAIRRQRLGQSMNLDYDPTAADPFAFKKATGTRNLAANENTLATLREQAVASLVALREYEEKLNTQPRHSELMKLLNYHAVIIPSLKREEEQKAAWEGLKQGVTQMAEDVRTTAFNVVRPVGALWKKTADTVQTTVSNTMEAIATETRETKDFERNLEEMLKRHYANPDNSDLINPDKLPYVRSMMIAARSASIAPDTKNQAMVDVDNLLSGASQDNPVPTALVIDYMSKQRHNQSAGIKAAVDIAVTRAQETAIAQEAAMQALFDKGIQGLNAGARGITDGANLLANGVEQIGALLDKGAKQGGKALQEVGQRIETALRQQAAKELVEKGIQGLNAGAKGIVDGASMAAEGIMQTAPVVVAGVERGVKAVGDAAAYVAEAQRVDYATKAKEVLNRALLTKDQKLNLLAGTTYAIDPTQKDVSDQQLADALSRIWADEKQKNGGATPRANMLMAFIEQEAARPKTNSELMARYGSKVTPNVTKAPYVIKDPGIIEPGYVYEGKGNTPYARVYPHVKDGRHTLKGDVYVTGIAKTNKKEATVLNGKDKTYAYADDMVGNLASGEARLIKTEGGEMVVMMDKKELEGATVRSGMKAQGQQGTFTEITMANGAKIIFESTQAVSIAEFKTTGENSYVFTGQLNAKDLAQLQQVEDTKRVAAANPAASKGLKDVSDGRNVNNAPAAPPPAAVPPAGGQGIQVGP